MKICCLAKPAIEIKCYDMGHEYVETEYTVQDAKG